MASSHAHRPSWAALIALVAGLVASPTTSRAAPAQLYLHNDSDVLAQLVNVEVVGPWLKGFISKIEAKVDASGKTARTVDVRIEIPAKGSMTVSVSAWPKLSAKVAAGIKALVPKSAPSRPSYWKAALTIRATAAGGSPSAPQPATLEEDMLAAMKRAGLAARVANTKRFAREVCLPFTAHIMTSVDAKFAGVRGFGATVTRFAAKPVGGGVQALTDTSGTYWRAVMEMVVGNTLPMLAKACMHLSVGEVDRSLNYVKVLFMLGDSQKFPSFAAMAKRLVARIQLVQHATSKQIKVGIKLFSANKLSAALKSFQATAKQHPHSASLQHEVTLTHAVSKSGLVGPSQAKVFLIDPMYPMRVVSKSGADLYETFRRQALPKLFKDRTKGLADLDEYALIAMELKAWSIAAHVYWLMSGMGPDKSAVERRSKRFLYATRKLGVKGFFAKPTAADDKADKALDAELTKRMTSSMMYKAMAKP